MRYTCALLVVVACGVTAVAQNNSLFNASPGPAAPMGPATTVEEPTRAAVSTELIPINVPQPVMSARQRTADESSKNVQNATLLAISPITVAAPEPKKLQVNDFVTVIVRQTMDRSSDATLKSEKDWKVKSQLSEFFRLNEENHLIPQTFADGKPGVEFDFDNEYEGKGKSSRKDSLTTRITARVLDIKPNGTLVIEAKNRIKSGEEEYIITLTGECRSEDVSAQNTVLSTQVYNLDLVHEPTGAVRDAARRGWLMRAFDLLRPL